jgi:hypothetical protein
VAFPTRSLGESQLDGLLATPVEGVAISSSIWASIRHVLCVSRTSVVSRVSRLSDRNVDYFEALGLEFCGPMNVPSSVGRRYSLCAVDFRSRLMLHDVVRSKDEAPASFRRMLTTIRSLEHTFRRLRMDDDTVFLCAAFRNLLNEYNIAVEVTAPYAHWQHG